LPDIETVTLKIKLLLKTEDGTIIVPRNNDDCIKTFLFQFPLNKLQKLKKDNNLRDIFYELMDYFYFYDFLADIRLYDVHITSIFFELENIEYDFSYTSSDIYDDYWTDEVKQIIEEKFEIYSQYGDYNFNEYDKKYCMDKINYDFKL